MLLSKVLLLTPGLVALIAAGSDSQQSLRVQACLEVLRADGSELPAPEQLSLQQLIAYQAIEGPGDPEMPPLARIISRKPS